MRWKRDALKRLLKDPLMFISSITYEGERYRDFRMEVYLYNTNKGAVVTSQALKLEKYRFTFIFWNDAIPH